MKTIEYHTMDDKAEWGAGPWVTEPDKVQYEVNGFPALIVRNRFGALCGYVGVSQGHPAFEQDYDDVDVEVHGGLTFSNFCQPGAEDEAICHVIEPGEDDHVWWLGFDCGHAFDLSPQSEAYYRKVDGINADFFLDHMTYRDIDYVRHEIELLAHQLRAMA